MSGPGISKGELNKSFVYVTDIMPTILEMTGVEFPDTYKGNEVLPMKGKSFSKVLSGEEEALYADSEYIAGEMQNGKWIRKGDLKAVYVTLPYGLNKWALYDLAIDPGETTDLSASKPDILSELISEWEKYSDEVGVVLMD